MCNNMYMYNNRYASLVTTPMWRSCDVNCACLNAGLLLLLTNTETLTDLESDFVTFSSFFAKPSMSETEYSEYVLNTCTDRISYTTTTQTVFTAEVVQLLKLFHQTTGTFSMLWLAPAHFFIHIFSVSRKKTKMLFVISSINVVELLMTFGV